MKEEEFADFIIQNTTKRAEFSTKDLPMYDKPVVYMALSDTECLYIGMSTIGLCRAFSRNHHVLSKIWDEITSLEVYQTPTPRAARDLESSMIREFKPKYNHRQCIRSLRGPHNKWGKGATQVIQTYNA